MNEQRKIELAFAIYTAKIVIGWLLIMFPVLFFIGVDEKQIDNYEFFVAGCFTVFLLGIYILIKNRKL